MNKPRNLNEDEIKKYNLMYYEGVEIPYSIETSAVIWSVMMKDNDPIYRLYNKGTNNLLILKYVWKEDKWFEIDLKEVHNLYGLLWIMCSELNNIGV